MCYVDETWGTELQRVYRRWYYTKEEGDMKPLIPCAHTASRWRNCLVFVYWVQFQGAPRWGGQCKSLCWMGIKMQKTQNLPRNVLRSWKCIDSQVVVSCSKQLIMTQLTVSITINAPLEKSRKHFGNQNISFTGVLLRTIGIVQSHRRGTKSWRYFTNTLLQRMEVFLLISQQNTMKSLRIKNRLHHGWDEGILSMLDEKSSSLLSNKKMVFSSQKSLMQRKYIVLNNKSRAGKQFLRILKIYRRLMSIKPYPKPSMIALYHPETIKNKTTFTTRLGNNYTTCSLSDLPLLSLCVLAK